MLEARQQQAAKLALLGCVLLVAGMLLWVSSGSPTTADICDQNPQTHLEECSSHHIALVAIWQIGRFLDEHNGLFNALFAGAVAAFTWRLYAATADLAAADRPQIFVGDFNVSGLKVEPDEYGQITISLRYSFNNFGKSPAFLNGVSLKVWQGRPAEFPAAPIYDKPHTERHIVVVGGNYFCRKPIELGPFPCADAQKIISGESFLILYGSVSYADTLNRPHKFRFAYRFLFEDSDMSIGISPYGPPSFWETT